MCPSSNAEVNEWTYTSTICICCRVVGWHHITSCLYVTRGVRSGTVGGGTAVQAGRSRVRFPMVSLELFIAIILPAALWLWCLLSL